LLSEEYEELDEEEDGTKFLKNDKYF